MSFLRHLGREYVNHKLNESSRRRYGRYGRPQRSVFFAPRRRRRSNVRVTGCCLPIPLGVFVVSVGAGGIAVRRRAAQSAG